MHKRIISLRKYTFAACSIICLVLCQTRMDAYQPGTQSLLTQEDYQEMKGVPNCSHEVMVLRDGTKMCGIVKQLPPMVYSFGIVEFKLDDLLGVVFAHPNKVQYISRDGQNFIGTAAPGERIHFLANDSKEVRLLDPEEIKFIVFKHHHLTKPLESKLYSLELQNGHHLPVYIESDRILVSNGWREYAIDPEEIAEIHFNGGAYGYLSDGNTIKKLNFSFIKDKYLEVHFPQQAESIKFPWDQIVTLQRGVGGFILEFLDDGNEMRYEMNAIGYTPNNLLDDVSGAVVVPPEVFARLDLEKFDASLSHDLELVSLFTKENEAEGGDEIVFAEEMNNVLKDELFEKLNEIAFEDSLQGLLSIEHKEFDLAMEEFDYHEMSENDEEEEGMSDIHKFQFSLAFPGDASEIADSGEAPIINQIDSHNKGKISHPVSKETRMIYVSSDTFSLGELTPSKEAYAKQHQLERTLLPTQGVPTVIVRTPGFFIDLNLVTNEQYAQFVKETAHAAPDHWQEGNIPDQQKNKPVVNISYKDARAYAVWKGKRLPTEMERIRALDKNLIANDDTASVPFTEWTLANTNRKQISCPLQLCRSKIMQMQDRFAHMSFRCAVDVPADQ